MKKTLHIIAIFVCLLFVAINGNAQSKVIHYWNFNTDTVANLHINNLKADYSVLTPNKAVFLLKAFPGTVSDTGYIDNYIPTAAAIDTPTINTIAQFGSPAGASIRVRNPSDSEMVLIYLPSTGYKNLRLQWMSEPSSATSGQKVQLYDYSVDSGATWKTSALSKTLDTTSPGGSTLFHLVQVNFADATDTSIRNNAKLVFRIKFAIQNTGTSGNSRFDNVTLLGDSLTATVVTPTGLAMINSNSGYSLYPNPAGSEISIHSGTSSVKNVTIINAIGQKMNNVVLSGTDNKIDVSRLAPGNYYAVIYDVVSGNSYTAKFTKQ